MSDGDYGFRGHWDWWCSWSRFGFDFAEPSLAASRVLFARRDVGVAVLFSFFFLDEIDVGDHDSFLVRVILVCFGSETVLVGFFVYLPLTFRIDATGTAFGDCSSPRRGICNDAPDIHASPHRSTSQLLPGASRESSPLFCIDTS